LAELEIALDAGPCLDQGISGCPGDQGQAIGWPVVAGRALDQAVHAQASGGVGLIKCGQGEPV
jgi:hypothetical protein